MNDVDARLTARPRSRTATMVALRLPRASAILPSSPPLASAAALLTFAAACGIELTAGAPPGSAMALGLALSAALALGRAREPRRAAARVRATRTTQTRRAPAGRQD